MEIKMDKEPITVNGLKKIKVELDSLKKLQLLLRQELMVILKRTQNIMLRKNSRPR